MHGYIRVIHPTTPRATKMNESDIRVAKKILWQHLSAVVLVQTFTKVNATVKTLLLYHYL